LHWLKRWFARHRNPINLTLHVVGIPAAVSAIPLAAFQRWVWAAVFLLAGYALQFVGHVIEGNRSGEEELFRRMLGRGRARLNG